MVDPLDTPSSQSLIQALRGCSSLIPVICIGHISVAEQAAIKAAAAAAKAHKQAAVLAGLKNLTTGQLAGGEVGSRKGGSVDFFLGG